jgi:hypothetical protein
MEQQDIYTAFHLERRIGSGTMEELLPVVRRWAAVHGESGILGFSDRTGGQIDFDLRGVMADRPGPGRPKMGVVAREVTLLPRHWEWLREQPGGASGALRRLIDEASRTPEAKARQTRDAAGRFLTAMAGNLPGYEEATRALYAGDAEGFRTRMAGWPEDIRTHALQLAQCEI